jgi:hypothetical protein
MRRVLAVIILFPLVLTAGSPKFEFYSVKVHPIRHFAPTKIPKSGIDWKMDRFLRHSDDEPVAFADRYTFGEIGCGTGCIEYCLIDRTSGAVYPGTDFNQDFPNDYHGLTGFQFRRDSKLFVVYHAVGFEYPIHVSYYVWEGTKPKFLQTDEIRSPK